MSRCRGTSPRRPRGVESARTGVTAILPGTGASVFRCPVPAGVAALNGAGELTGFLQVSEWGLIETPVYLTSTMAVGRVFDGAVAVACAADAAVGVDDVVIPVVGECDDSWLNDARTVQVEAADAARAVAAARGGTIEQGCVGAGTGMVAFGWKGGIGSSSRLVPDVDATIGVLVLANFGAARDLRIDGVPAFPTIGDGRDPRPPAGSCIAIVATDAPLDAAQLERLARRAGLGLARVGSVAHHGSGEIFLAFSTAAAEREERASASGSTGPRFRTATSTRSSRPWWRRPRRRCSTPSGRPLTRPGAKDDSSARCRTSRC